MTYARTYKNQVSGTIYEAKEITDPNIAEKLLKKWHLTLHYEDHNRYYEQIVKMQDANEPNLFEGITVWPVQLPDRKNTSYITGEFAPQMVTSFNFKFDELLQDLFDHGALAITVKGLKEPFYYYILPYDLYYTSNVNEKFDKFMLNHFNSKVTKTMNK